MAPAYRLETERCVLRCFDPRDARELHELVRANREHLARWLEWARDEPLQLAERVELLRRFRRRFDGDEDWAYALLAADRGGLLGSVAIHPCPGEAAAFAVGYWIAREVGGRGLATEAVAAVVRCAFEVQHAARVEIHCDASNVRSRALAERLGFRLDAELRDRGHAPGEARAVHSLLRTEYAASPAARFATRAYDAQGDAIALSADATSRSAFRPATR